MSGEETEEALSPTHTSLLLPPMDSTTITSAVAEPGGIQVTPVHLSEANPGTEAMTQEELNETTALSPKANDNDDDDDLSSTTSSSSSASSATEVTASWQALDYAERRARRIARNEAYLTSLGLMKQSKRTIPSRRKRTEENADDKETDQHHNRQGMLLSSRSSSSSSSFSATHHRHTATTSLDDLFLAFPGRTTEIRSLYAHLSYALRSTRRRMNNNDTTATAVPTPLWVTGSAGMGKTDVVQAILQNLVTPTPSITNDAVVIYCHAAQIPPPLTVEGLVAFLYQELWKQLGLAGGDDVTDTVHVKKTKKRRRWENDNNDNHSTKSSRSTLRRRASTTSSTSQKTSQTARRTAADMAESTTITKSNKAYTAIWTLGRLWKNLTGNRPSILVLDQVWTRMRRDGGTNTNPLAQFLLLPQHLQLNLTVVVVTQNVLLDQTPLSLAGNASGSIASCLHPIRIHFPTYRSKNILEKILSLPRIGGMIVGTDNPHNVNEQNDFQQQVYRSFVRTLIQSTYEVTRDVKEIIRFGRILWPQYIEVLQPSKIGSTLASISRKLASFKPPVEATTARVRQELLTFLDSRALQRMRHFLEDHLFSVSAPIAVQGETHIHDMPPRAKYLLLAAYLCQVNRPERDRHLFTIQKSGRRRKSVTEQNTASEDTAFGTQTGAQPRTLRLRTFPLERMLSIFVSLISLQSEETSTESLPEKDTERLLSLGDISLLQNLHLLQDAGLLHDHSEGDSNGPIRLSGRRYWCELTEDEALRLAETLDFPLTRYML